MSLFVTVMMSALGTAILLMAMVWKLWPSWYSAPGNTVNVTGGGAPSLHRRNSPKQSPSRP